MRCPRRVTEEGFEMQLGVNHLGTSFLDCFNLLIYFFLFTGHFYLTNLLIDNLKENAPSKIINITCTAYKKGQINLDDLNSERSYKPAVAYNQSKLANVLFTTELARRLQGTRVYVYAVNPGITRTKIVRHMSFHNSFISGYLLAPFFWLFERTPFQASQAILNVVLNPELENDNASGKYYKYVMSTNL